LPLAKSQEWSDEELLRYEREMLGFYVTKHPLTKYEKLIKEIASATIADLPQLKEGAMVKIGGIITKISGKSMRGPSGQSERSYFLKFRDLTGIVDVVVYPDAFQRNKDLIQNDCIVFIKGRLAFRKGAPLINAKDMASIDEGYESLADKLVVNLSSVGLENQIIQGLHDIFLAHPGTCPVFLNIVTPEGQKVSIKVGNNYFITPSQRLINDINELIGEGHLMFN